MADDNGLSVEFCRNGNGTTGTLTAKLGKDVLHVDRLDVTKSRDREAFLKKLCEGRPGLDSQRDGIAEQLRKLAAEEAGRGDGQRPAEAANPPEIDVSRVVRPERFITPEVSGLAVPTMTLIGDRPEAQWTLYLRWADGSRERQAIPPAIDLPGGKRLWIRPQPSPPPEATPARWSKEARQRWLETGGSPDPAELFRRLCERIAYFVDLPKGHAPGITATLALWAMLTYVYQAWDAVPYLFIGGPLASGKTLVFDILVRLVFRPLQSSNMTAAVLFRTLHNQGGTLLFDEAERLRQTNSPEVGEILSMLLAGYKRSGRAMRMEPHGETFKTACFDVYGSKALACIAGPPAALASRCIRLTMFRAGPGSQKPRRRIDADPGGWQSLRDDLHALAIENGATWLELPERGDVCPPMSGRDYELWQPLLALASWVESYGAKGLLKLMQGHARVVIDSGKDDQTPDHDEALLKILADNIRSSYAPTSGEILDKAQETEPKMFKLWTARAVSSHMKRYGLETNKTGGRRVYGHVTPAELRLIQDNYGMDLGIDDEPDGT